MPDQADIDKNFAESLMGEGGLLGDHMSAGIRGMSDADQLKFHQALATSEGAKVSKATRKEPPARDDQHVPHDALDDLKDLYKVIQGEFIAVC